MMPAETNYNIVEKESPTFYFIGVTTGQSSINNVFPLWTEALGRPDVVLEGIDCQLNDDPDTYRAAVAQIKYDPNSLGGLVTAHKINLLNAARDMFDYLDPYAEITGEISSISKRDGQLEGHAKDPITGGLSLSAMIGENYFARTGGEVLILGCGGSAVAISLHLISQPNAGDRPKRITVVNLTQPRLDHLREMVERHDTDIEFEFICNDNATRNDERMASLPDGSIVINATGMGKDTPGSPITDGGLFPKNGIAWELNYRGELDFLQQALRQTETRHVTVEDGWIYFVHGWSQVIAQVYHMEIDATLFKRLSDLALAARKR
jgi:shikimate 5-dehydrogenase